MVNSKQKGGEFERSVCKKLSLWLTHGKRQDCLWRSAMSGGRATVNRKRGIANKTQCGDISAVSPEGHKLTDLFVIECKSYRNLDIAQGLILGRGKLAEFWKELRVEAKAANKEPLLIAKQSRFETLLVTTYVGADVLGLRTSGYIYKCNTARALYGPANIFVFKNLLATKCDL